MSEETQDHNDGTWSGLKKTIVGTLSTAVLAGGTWVTTTLFGGHDEPKEETKTEQSAPAQQPVINLNVDNSSQNNSSNGGGTTTVIREKVTEKPAKEKKEEKSESTDAPW